MTFLQRLEQLQEKNNSLVCVGLDSDIDNLPEQLRSQDKPQFAFNKWIIDKTHEYVCAYKPNTAFYEARGAQGIQELKDTCDYLHKTHPDIPIILDAKRADIGNTNKGYIKFAFEYLGADAITVNPYLGQGAVQPFLDRKDKGVIILCKTSNEGSDEFQNASTVIPERFADRESIQNNSEDINYQGKPKLYQYVAQNIIKNWNTNNNCILVVGATYPEELEEVRGIAKDVTLLIPGIGAQGGDIEKTLKAGLRTDGKGLIINSSRGIIFSDNPETEVKKLRSKINNYR